MYAIMKIFLLSASKIKQTLNMATDLLEKYVKVSKWIIATVDSNIICGLSQGLICFLSIGMSKYPTVLIMLMILVIATINPLINTILINSHLFKRNILN